MPDSVRLTKREREVESFVYRKWTDKQIADHLCVSPKTIGHHIESILKKRGAANRHGLKASPPRVGEFVECRGATWQVYGFDTDDDGCRVTILIDPNYDAQSNTPDPTLYLRDSSEILVIGAVA